MIDKEELLSILNTHLIIRVDRGYEGAGRIELIWKEEEANSSFDPVEHIISTTWID